MKVQEDVQRSLNRAAHREIEVRNLMNAVSGSKNDYVSTLVSGRALPRTKPVHYLPPKPRAVRPDVNNYSGETSIEEEAREAGAKSLYERDPLDHTLPVRKNAVDFSYLSEELFNAISCLLLAI